MPDVDVDQVKAVLLEMKAQKREGKDRNPVAAFRRGIADRLEATRLLSSIGAPFTPEQITLDTPFLIWALRDGMEASNILVDSQIVKGGSWAKISSSVKTDGQIGADDTVNFYFLWQNFTGQPAVVNVESFLMLDGSCTADGHGGWIWTPLWGTNTFGSAILNVNANLSLLEWWNQPPTTPLQEPGQTQNVVNLDSEGSWKGWGTSNSTTQAVSSNYHVYYDTFYIPQDGVALFEVGVEVEFGGINGEGSADFATDPFIIICPHLQLEISTTPQPNPTSLA
jgi:hypothetical protein